MLLRQLKQTTALVFTADDNVQLKILVTQLKILGSTSTFYRDYVKVCAVPRRNIRIDSYPLLGRFVHGTPVRKQKNYYSYSHVQAENRAPIGIAFFS